MTATMISVVLLCELLLSLLVAVPTSAPSPAPPAAAATTAAAAAVDAISDDGDVGGGGNNNGGGGSSILPVRVNQACVTNRIRVSRCIQSISIFGPVYPQTRTNASAFCLSGGGAVGCRPLSLGESEPAFNLPRTQNTGPDLPTPEP